MNSAPPNLDRHNATVRVLVTFSVLLTLGCDSARSAESTVEAFQRFAERFQFIGVNELLYARAEIYLADPVAMKAYVPLLAEFRGRNDAVEDVIPLLRHPNPRVRVLAIMALYLKGADHALPNINELANDPQPSFPDPPVDELRVNASGIGPPHEPKTVGEVANAVLKFYYQAAGGNCLWLRADQRFAQYWEPRKGRKNCAGWFVVRLHRANHGGAWPLSPDFLPLIQDVRRQVDQVPVDERRWILLQLAQSQAGMNCRGHLVTQDELGRICHEIGSEPLRGLIRNIAVRGDARRIPGVSDDPDLSLSQLPWFMYEHAKDLLTDKDADDVLTAGNVIAAAELRPTMASKWLRVEFDKQPRGGEVAHRAGILYAMWRIVGPAEIDFVVNHYFDDPTDTHEPPCERACFLQASAQSPRPEFRELVAKIILDRRFDQTGPESTYTIALIVNRWVEKPIIPEQELRMSGVSAVHDELDTQGEKLKSLAEWHAKLRASVPLWRPKP